MQKELKRQHHLAKKMETRDDYPLHHHINVQTDQEFFNDENETPAHRKARLEGYYTKGVKLGNESAHNNDIAEHGVMSLSQ
jgi:hypothetical protein